MAIPAKAARDWVEAEVRRTNTFNSAALAWPGRVRKLDRIDPSFRT